MCRTQCHRHLSLSAYVLMDLSEFISRHSWLEYEYRPADRSFRHTPRVSLITLPSKAQEALDWEMRDPWQIVTNALLVRDEPQPVYFLINRDICFIQWKVTSVQQKPAVDCVLCIVWMSMNVVSSVHFQMSSFIQSANINIERKQIFDRYLSPKSYHHYSFSLWSLDYCTANHNNKIDWINRQWNYGLIKHKHNSLCSTHCCIYYPHFLRNKPNTIHFKCKKGSGRFSWKK